MKKYSSILIILLVILTGCSQDVVAKFNPTKLDVSEEIEIREPMDKIIERLETSDNDYEKNDYVSLYEEDGTTVTHVNGKRVTHLKFLGMTVYEVRYEFSDRVDDEQPNADLLIRAHYFVKPNKFNRTKEVLENTLSNQFERATEQKKFWRDETSIIFYEYTANGQIRIMVEDRELFEEEFISLQ